MNKVLLCLGVLIGSCLGTYGLAAAAQTVIGTTALNGNQAVTVTCSATKLRTVRVSARVVTARCSGRVITTSPVPPTAKPPSTDPTTTTPPATATAGTCNSPTFTTSDPEGTDNTDPSDGSQFLWINNDAWSGSHGPQTLNVCNESSWTAVSNQPDNGGAVETYPDTEYDVGGRDNPSTAPISAYKSITSTFSEAFPTANGSWDAAYDVWLNNWSKEIMIWNEWSGAQSYWPSQATQMLTLDGVPYSFYDNGGELMFFRQTQVKSGPVDILAALQWLVSQGLVNSTDTPTQLEYGVEVCSTNGSETFPMTGLTFSLS